MNSEKIIPGNLEKEKSGSQFHFNIFKNEVKGVDIQLVSIKGGSHFHPNIKNNVYDVFISLSGKARIYLNEITREVGENFIIRLPYGREYTIVVEEGDEFHFLHFRILLDSNDIKAIQNDPEIHSELYCKPIIECPIYTEDIKSSKTVSRMILAEEMVPRFCMGSVETEGPDEVAEHDHPMLEQLFLGLKDCNCICIADGEEFLLTENTLVHIPLGSHHSVKVREGDKLAYIWLDFFLSLEGQKYMSEQHKMDDD